MKKKITLLLGLLLSGVAALIAQNALSPDINVTLENEANINTGSLEYSPAFYENGIIFISDTKIGGGGLLDARIGKNAMSIFRAKRDGEGKLGEPKPFAEEITTKYHEGPLSFNKTNNKIFFTRDNYEDGKAIESSDDVIKLQIFSAQQLGDKWGAVKKLSFNDKESDYAHPSINVDDTILYFASNRPGGFGGMDLWKVEGSGDSWGEPVNLGANVNTSGHEIFPQIHADGTLFFSSYGHNSMGGLDIFFSKEESGAFATPVNLGPKFNSSADDLGFIIDRDKRNGYLSSNRESGSGQDDIYSFFIDVPLGEDIFEDPGPEESLAGGDGTDAGGVNGAGPLNTNGSELAGFGNNKVLIFVADRSTGAELSSSTIEYVDLEALTNTEIITDQDGNIIQLVSTQNGQVVTISTEPGTVTGTTDSEGAFVLKLAEGNYLVNIAKDGYQPKQIIVSMADGRDEYMVLLDRAVNCVTIKGAVLYDSNNPVSGANVLISSSNGATRENVTTSSSGAFEVCLPCGENYTLTATKNSVISSKTLATDANCNGGAPLFLTINLPGDGSGGIPDGTIIRLAKIYYNFNDASIRPDARDELSTLASILSTYKNINVELSSHTDSRGGTDYNNQLSQRRADKVVAYLVEQGIDPSRLTATGYGESQLLNHCADGVQCSELDHQYNRRTEVKVLDNTVQVEYVNNPPESIDNAPSSVFIGSSNTTSSSPSVSNGTSSGTYYVIAGTFSVQQNAIDRLSRIQTLGFGEAYILQSSSTAANAVCVGTFTNYNEARALADQVENVHNIHTYVRRGG